MEDIAKETRQIVQQAIRRGQKINVTLLAHRFGISTSQFYRKIKSQTGYAPAIFIRNIRLEKAEKYLRTRRISVHQVAVQVGFSDSTYLIRCFTKRYGTTPKQYQKQYQTIRSRKK